MNLIKNIQLKCNRNICIHLRCIIFVNKFSTSSTNKNELSPSKLRRFVPDSQSLEDDDYCKINDFVTKSNKLFVLSGAGLSTESGLNLYFDNNSKEYLLN